MFLQPVQRPSSESNDSFSQFYSEDGFRTGCQNIGHRQQSFSGLQSLGVAVTISSSVPHQCSHFRKYNPVKKEAFAQDDIKQRSACVLFK